MAQPAQRPLRVVHVTSPMPSDRVLWGKERVIAQLARAQRAGGTVAPEIVLLDPAPLLEPLAAAGIPVTTLAGAKLPLRWLRRFAGAATEPFVVHAHEYKANVLMRAGRVLFGGRYGLVTTSHGFENHTRALRVYNWLDRATAGFTDVVTAPDPAMLDMFGRARDRVWVPNGITEREPPSAVARAAARARFGWRSDRWYIGAAGRLTAAKGVDVFLAAAAATADTPIVWAIAGDGPMRELIESGAPPNVAYVGLLPALDEFTAALDAFVQPSLSEGLSVALLEAMRDGLPIVATPVGATARIVRDGSEAVLVPAGDSVALAAAARQLASDPMRAADLGAAARQRFLEVATASRQVDCFLELYRRALDARAGRPT